MSKHISFKNPCHVHFIGIGGISMSGLAEILLDRGFTVTGSDRSETELTTHLTELGAHIFYPQAAENIDKANEISKIDVVVYTAAIHPDNPEFVRTNDLGLKIIRRAELLGSIMDEYPLAIAVAGTHGKTTTTSMISEIFLAKDGNLEKTENGYVFSDKNKDKVPTVTVGGILPAINSNVLVGSSETFIAEACEYQNSFLEFYPEYALVLNVEEDHLDFFKDINDIRNSFHTYCSHVREDGAVIISDKIPEYKALTEGINRKVITFGISAEGNGPDDADSTAKDISVNEKGCYSFTPIYKGEELPHVTLHVPGRHNILNALAAIAVCKEAGVSNESIIRGLSDFSGTHRRFEYRGTFNGATVIDDYAHHPTEMAATISAAKNVKHNKLIVVFQPHTYTRLRVFLQQFADVLSEADTVVLAPVYAAREKDVYGVHSTDIRNILVKKGCDAYAFDSFSEIEEFLSKKVADGDLLITMGAGDVVTVANDITKQ